jgi:hypothetical protein
MYLIQLTLCLIKHTNMKTFGGVQGQSDIPDLGMRWRREITFTPQPLYFLDIAHRIHWIEGWYLCCGEKTNILSLPDIESRYYSGGPNPYPLLYPLISLN